MRTRAEQRHYNASKARRKQNIARKVYGWDYYDNLHQYSKNKIHCSCPSCSCKTRKRIKNGYGKIYFPPVSDQKRIDEMEYEVKEFLLNEF